ncbi:tetratricopeptide repeat protein [Planosporangium thailandense]|uniref:Tetratricopeptide repeat protein n=1 Tax=Planosporangium thailandense TaxID=765197 RepID=A0ABX0Y6W8_9ACTN|nr:BTAD domain-containing putative transcriptional regulator [Planosporangium thailandense]NJC73852.1 tetratricopeptide repeat protein [Planosporangium thailandense]
MRFGILGALRIRVGDTETTLVAGRERTVLAMLLLYAGKVVPVERLAEAVWGETPPPTMRAQVHSCVSRLRRALRRSGIHDEVIVTDPAGYVARVAASDLDSLVFAQLVADGRRSAAAGRLEEARVHLRAALALWRGPAAAGIGSRQIEIAAAGLEEQRSAVLEDCVDIELRLDLAHELVGELTGLVERFPVRERLRGQLMLALYRVGRQADALAVYRQGRDALADELGLEPGPQLQELHRRILNRDPALLVGDGAEPPTAAPRPAARHALPRDVVDFTGREEQVARLLGFVPADPQEGPATPVIEVIDGMAGTGKTSLAVHVAHLVADRYPDAQLFIDLHGHSDRAPVVPGRALDTLLRQLGIAADRIPERLDERVTLWRSELATRRALVVLDNAADSAQVLPLLPGGSRGLTLVTSRRRLTGLDGVHHLSLDVLDAAESVRLLARVAGDRVDTEPAAAAEVARLCGYLPLALRLAAARLVHRPSWTVGDLADRLRGAGAPLSELAVEGRTVSAAFALSYQHLDESAQRVFRLLGVHPPNGFDAYAAAALADLDVDRADDILEELVDAHLLESPSARRYRLHDLLHEYAWELAVEEEPEVEREAAAGRMIDHYLHTGFRATGFLELTYTRQELELPDPPRGIPDIASEGEAFAWLERERSNAMAVARLAARLGLHRQVCGLARALWIYLWLNGYANELIEIQQLALSSAGALGDEAAVATAHNYLAAGLVRRGHWTDGLEHLHRALAIRRRLGDVPGQAATLSNLGMTYRITGRYPEAVDHFQQQLVLARSLPSDVLSRGLADLGHVYQLLGRYDEALRQHRKHLAMSRQTGNRYQQGLALSEIAAAHVRMGHYRVAVLLLKRVMQLKVEVGNRYGMAESLSDLGSAYRGLGRYTEAVDCQRQALRLMCEVGDPAGECQILNDLGITLRVVGEPGEASEMHRQALTLAERLGLRHHQARAHRGLAEIWEDTDPALAREQWTAALQLFTDLGVPERHEAERRLADLDHGPRRLRVPRQRVVREVPARILRPPHSVGA